MAGLTWLRKKSLKLNLITTKKACSMQAFLVLKWSSLQGTKQSQSLLHVPKFVALNLEIATLSLAMTSSS
jgi:hypothetical protein